MNARRKYARVPARDQLEPPVRDLYTAFASIGFPPDECVRLARIAHRQGRTLADITAMKERSGSLKQSIFVYVRRVIEQGYRR